jgi:SAM-dependent methyltransferase
MPNIFKRLRLYLSIIQYSLAHNPDFAKENYTFFREMQTYLQRHEVNLKGLRVLDVGCGKSYWLTLLLHSAGAKATGIDTELVEPGRSLNKYFKIFRKNGLDRAARTLFWDTVFGQPYYRHLQALCPFPLNFSGIDVHSMSVTSSDFPDNTFDLIVSHEVFEHISDLPGTARELRRVMKPESITYIYVHNYPSISGGHSIAWKYPDSEPSAIVPPWDHLRQNLYPDIPSWINRLRQPAYRQAFEEHFEIIDWFPRGREGEKLLTPKIQAELSDYEADELLTKGFVIVARPLPKSEIAPANSSVMEIHQG